MDIWTQIYDPLGELTPLPEYLLSALVAAIPLFILFFLLAVRRTRGHVAAAWAVGAAILLAIIVWKMPAGMAISSTLNGALFGLFPICWIVVTAVWVYNMTVESGGFERAFEYSASAVRCHRPKGPHP